MSEQLTAIQRTTLNIIREGVRDGRPVTFRDIANRRGVSVNAVSQCVQSLAKKGLLTLGNGKSRGIRLTEPSPLERARGLLVRFGREVADPPSELAADIEKFLQEAT